ETFPERYEDHPVSQFRRGPVSDPYRESLYVGYRWFDSAKLRVAFPFGHGLSYTTFTWSDTRVSWRRSQDDDVLDVRVRVTNTGARQGSDVVQLYVRDV